jgi:hypothetical protein
MSQPSEVGPADAGFLCGKAAMLGDMKKEPLLRQTVLEVG